MATNDTSGVKDATGNAIGAERLRVAEQQAILTRMPLSLRSSVFGPGGEIPRRHTCQGEDLSVPLEWDGAPAGTQSFALIVDDPDAPDPAKPRLVWTHWV